ncbi:uncharacterized protein LOC122003448 [Zingiber officinale]|uniref:uncharacterized protein LOC122003448 n=1 Tax=Zingiber officinale TaxID=94328 RepID=UPI001C4C730C|nr:uncharacterized protein LOC122003448 [Zingiber officinale]
MASPPPPPPCEMAEMELAAAQALAHLAGAAATESGGEGSSSRKRIKSESPPMAQPRSVHFRDQEVTSSAPGCSRDYIADKVEELIDINQNFEMIKSSVKIPSTSSPSSSRSTRVKQNLTEAEKEERRLRRVLANRESARQTIRRRQALREELTKKVVDLSMENENMKLEKDLAMKEYLSLKDANEKLKEQIARAMRFEDEKNPDVTTSKSESSTPLISKPQLITYEKTPVLSVMYPPRPFIPQDATVFEQGGSSYISGSMPSHYMPCSWYYPLPREVSGSTMYSESTQSKDVEQIGSELELKQPRNQLDVMERLSLQGVRRAPKDPATIVAAKEVLRPSPERPTSCHEISLCHDKDKEKDKDIAEELQGYCTWPPDKVSSSMTATTRTAADARKRRKEITKLKQLHGRHTG